MRKLHKKAFTLFPVKLTSSQSDFMLKCSNFMTNSLCHAPIEACAIFWLPLKRKRLLRIYFQSNFMFTRANLSFYHSIAKHCCSATKPQKIFLRLSNIFLVLKCWWAKARAEKESKLKTKMDKSKHKLRQVKKTW